MPIYTVQIPVETTIHCEIEADDIAQARSIADKNTYSLISKNSENHDGFEFDHRGEIELDELQTKS